MPRKEQPVQRTQPKKGEPIEIPIPKRSTIDKLLKRAARQRADNLKRSGD